MKPTGIVTRIDDLGRVVIPRNICETLHIRGGDPFEIFIDPNKRAVCFKPYLSYFEPWRQLEDIAEIMSDNENFHKFAADVYALAQEIKQSAQD